MRGPRAGPARAVCPAAPPPAGSIPGAPSLRLLGPPPRSPARLIPRLGAGYRPGSAARGSGCSTGPAWNRPILKPPDTMRPWPVRPWPVGGPEAFRSAALSPMAARPFRRLVPRRHAGGGAGRRRGTAPGHRGWLRDGQERAWPRSQRDPLLAGLAPACRARVVGQFERNSSPVIPERRDAASPDSMNTGFSKAFEACVAGFRVRGPSTSSGPRPGMTRLQFKLTHCPRSSCWPSRCRPPSAIRPTPPRPQKAA